MSEGAGSPGAISGPKVPSHMGTSPRGGDRDGDGGAGDNTKGDQSGEGNHQNGGSQASNSRAASARNSRRGTLDSDFDSSNEGSAEPGDVRLVGRRGSGSSSNSSDDRRLPAGRVQEASESSDDEEVLLTAGPKRNMNGTLKVCLAIVGVLTGVALVALIIAFSHRGVGPRVPAAELASRPTLRLPKGIDPNTYDLSIVVDMTGPDYGYTGTVIIETVVGSPMDELYIHAAAPLVLDSAKMTSAGGMVVDAVTITPSTYDQVVIDFDQVISAGYWTFEIEFHSDLSYERLHGFYLSSYYDGPTLKHMGSTQMEPTYARETFPCFDEPHLKAHFTISIEVDSEYTVLSNMPEETASFGSNPGSTVHTFAQSPRMSTYLVAWTIGEFAFVEHPTPVSGATLRVYSRNSAIAEAAYALDVASRVVPEFDSFFGIDYGLRMDKMDLIAIPDFEAGAMENWGLITFRESDLLVASGAAGALKYQQRVAEVVAHEIAHQWTGDLVTMEWFNELWLNEGFATFFSNLILSKVEPTWRLEDTFVLGSQGAMETDALSGTHTVVIGDQDDPGSLLPPAEIEGLFDSITYTKGGSLLKLLYDYSTEYGVSLDNGYESFKVGIQTYLADHATLSANTLELWEGLSSAFGRDVGEMMGAWVGSLGFPVVSLERTDDGRVRATQTRFNRVFQSLDTPEGPGGSAEDPWWIPLTIMTPGSPPAVYETNLASQYLNVPNTGAWIAANCNRGFYRVNYTPTNWAALTSALAADITAMPDPRGRAGLVNDAFALALAEQVDIDVPLGLAEAMAAERDPVVISSLLSGLSTMTPFLADDTIRTNYKAWAASIVDPMIAYFGNQTVPGEDPTATLLRPSLIGFAASHDHGETVAALLAAYAAFAADPVGSPLDPNLKDVVYNTFVAAGNGYYDMKARYEAARLDGTDPDEVVYCLRAMASTTDEAEVVDLMDYMVSFDDNNILYVRAQDWRWVFRSLSGLAAQRYALDQLGDHWEMFAAVLGKGAISSVASLTSALNTVEDQAQITAFFYEHRLAGTARQQLNIIENIGANIIFNRDYVPLLEARFATSGGGSGAGGP